MAVKKGTLSIDSENIFPIIKKWVYSDHDIFVRELISNGCDAVTKLKKLDMMGEYELPEDYKAKIEVIVNPEEKTMKFIDNGLGMTAEEVEEYITQIAFSGATQFLEKYKDKTTEDDMIGHFGLGFYSAFMVADEVQIDTLSYKEGASAVHWASQGGTEYEMQEGNKETVGTEITLFLNEDSLAFANEYRAREVIEKYCSFMPVEIFLSKANAQPEYETIDEEDVLDTDEVVEHITEEVKAGNTPDDRKRLSPTLSVSIQPWKEEQLYVRAMYKNTFRVPTFNDLYYLRIGNTSLRPEKAREYNIGVTWNGKPFSFTDFLSITLDGYYNEVTDKIVAFPSTYVWKMQNYGTVHITGLDATMATSIPVCPNINVGLSGNYSWQKAIDMTNPDAKNYKDQLPYTPQHSGNASTTIETPWINVGYSLTGVSERYYMAQNIPVNKIDGYVEHTATLWREFTMKGCHLRLQAEVINLTDKQYDVIKYYPMPGRSWRITGVLRF